MSRRSRTILPGITIAVLTALLVWRWDRLPEPDGRAVLAQVRQLNQLATVRYTIQKVIGLEERSQPVGSEKILLVLQANVEAGVDLATLGPQQIERRSDGALVIHLPPAQVLNVFIDEKETKVWDRQKTWWTPWIPWSVDLEKKARLLGLDAVREAAIESGILRQAERNAEASIRGLLQLSGVRNVVIILNKRVRSNLQDRIPL